MLSAHDNYVQGHAALFTAATEKDLHQASVTTVENYLENRKIWAELQYYKEKGTILGKHPIFNRLRRIDEIRSMKIIDMVHLKYRLENNLVRNRAALKSHPDHPETMNRRNRIAEMETELAEVNRQLNIS